MKYSGMPAAMWLLYRKSFQRALVKDLKKSPEEAERIMAKAKPKYREVIGKLPEFEKGDRFKTNIVNCAILISVFLSMDSKPTVTEATTYYEHAMTNFATKAFCKMGGKQKFTDKDIEEMKKTAALNAADRNPYSWNMEYLPYEDGSGYEARFSKCGICTLMKEYGLFELVPAMCHLDYTMSEIGGASTFVREYTLASGGPYCDCGYKKKSDSYKSQRSDDAKKKSRDYFNTHKTSKLAHEGYWKHDYKYALAVIKRISPDNLIDIGCGPGAFLEEVHRNFPDIKLSALDLSEEMIEVTRSRLSGNVNALVGDSENMPIEDEQYKIVTCNMSIHHYPHPQKAVNEMYRILQNGGYLMLNDMDCIAPIRAVANFFFPRMKAGDVKMYNKDEILHFMHNAGFRKVKYRKISPFSFQCIARKKE